MSRNREYIEPLNSQSFYDSSYFYTLLDNNIYTHILDFTIHDNAGRNLHDICLTCGSYHFVYNFQPLLCSTVPRLQSVHPAHRL